VRWCRIFSKTCKSKENNDLHTTHSRTKIPDICIIENGTITNKSSRGDRSTSLNSMPGNQAEQRQTRISATTSTKKSRIQAAESKSQDTKGCLGPGGTKTVPGLEPGANLWTIEEIGLALI
jgi:hypothetical protein